MEPTLYDGDRILVSYRASPQPGRLAIVRLPDGQLAVKRLAHKEIGGWWVERDNPHEGVDSWAVGAIATTDVIAVVIRRVWRRGHRD